MVNMFSKLFKSMISHKLITSIALFAIFFGGYFGYKAISGSNETIRYVTAAVEKNTLIVSVSGSGQVSALDQIDIKSKVRSEVAAIYIETGEEVKKGKLIIKLDDTDFQKVARDAEISLETAKLELEELLSPPDDLTLLQAENSLAKARESKGKAEDNIIKAYENAFNAITNAFLDLPTIITGVRDILYSYEITESERTINKYQTNESVYRNSFIGDDRYKIEPFIENAENDYKIAKENYNQNFEAYNNTSRYSEKGIIEALLNKTIETIKSIAEAVKKETHLLDFTVDYFSNQDKNIYSKVTEYQSDLKTYTGKINSHLLNLLSVQRSLEDNREDVVNAERLIEERELSLTKLKASPDELDIRTKEIIIQQKENILLTAKQDLADSYIYTPFKGIIAEIKIKKDDLVSADTALVNIITQQKIAKIFLNEIDAAKVKVGQKATLIFDALPEVSISGKVIEVDVVGQVSQGVVTYGVKITFDVDMEQVKPGMSVTVDIITNAKQDVLVLPSSAIKFRGDSYYVELVEASEEMRQQLLATVSGIILPTSPKPQSVKIGLSNDLFIEIISGLKEGDIVVSSVVSSNSAQTTQSQGLFRVPGMGGRRGF